MFDKNKLSMNSFLNALGTVLYIALVAWLMSNGNKIFENKPEILNGIGILLLFVLSALITGLLVLGKPIYLYWEGQKIKGIKLLIATALWLIIFTTIIFIILTIT